MEAEPGLAAGFAAGFDCYDAECFANPGTVGRGLGRAQVDEVIARLSAEGFAAVEVSTGEHPFFAPAQRMYLACGFVETHRTPPGPGAAYGTVNYKLELRQAAV